MVNSRINNKINYLEVNSVDLNDIDHESHLYIGTLYNKNVYFTIGIPMYDFVDLNVIYFYLYLVKENQVIMKIGLYEFKKETFDTLTSNNQDIDISKFNPIIFSFVKTYIINQYDEEIQLNRPLNPQKTNDADNTDNADDTNDADDATDADDADDADELDLPKAPKIEPKKRVKVQTQEESDAEIEAYVEKTTDKWINKYLQSNKYDIINNEGGGDCFFAALRDALKSTNKDEYSNLTVNTIRDKLSQEVDETIYNRYKELIGFSGSGLKTTSKEISTSREIHQILKKQVGGAGSKEEREQYLSNAKNNIDKLNKSIDRQREYKNIYEEFKFMRDVNSIDDLKKVIKTNEYWADLWAVATLERIYNVKFIIFSKEHFESGEFDNVIKCYDMDKKLLDKGIFNPDYYILLDYEQDIHYQLIIYDKNFNIKAFSFAELPYRIKELFVEKCIELTNFNSNYLIIPDIAEFIEEKNNTTPDAVDKIKIKNKDQQEFEDFLNKSKDLEYDDNVVIQFYNKSTDKKVGYGAGEHIKLNQYKKLDDNIVTLNKIKDWRKKLDNNWIVDNLTIDGNEFSSVQHYLYALRFNNSREIFSKFLKNNSHEAGNDIDKAKKLYEQILKNKKNYDFSFINESEYEELISQNIEKALYAKFNQNADLLRILKLTKNYKLNVYKQKQGGVLARDIMNVRKLFNK